MARTKWKHKTHLTMKDGKTMCGWAQSNAHDIMVWAPSKGVPEHSKVCEMCKKYLKKSS